MLYSSAKTGDFEMRVNATSRARQTDMVTPVHKKWYSCTWTQAMDKATLTISLPRTMKKFIKAKLREGPLQHTQRIHSIAGFAMIRIWQAIKNWLL